jgi:hypothetical protein
LAHAVIDAVRALPVNALQLLDLSDPHLFLVHDPPAQRSGKVEESRARPTIMLMHDNSRKHPAAGGILFSRHFTEEVSQTLIVRLEPYGIYVPAKVRIGHSPASLRLLDHGCASLPLC